MPTQPNTDDLHRERVDAVLADIVDRLDRLERRLDVVDVADTVTVDDAARILKVCRQTVYSLVDRGFLRGNQKSPKGRILIHRDDLRDYVFRRAR